MEQNNRKPFDLERALAGDPVVTRTGLPVKIAGYNPDADHPFIGCVGNKPQGWDKDGVLNLVGAEVRGGEYDLFMGQLERTGWVNIVRTPDGNLMACPDIYKSLQEALDSTPPGILTTTRATWTE